MLTLLSIAVGSPSPLCPVRPSPLPCPLQEKEQNFDIHCIAMGIICESTITSCTIATLYQCTLAHAHAWSILLYIHPRHNVQWYARFTKISTRKINISDLKIVQQCCCTLREQSTMGYMVQSNYTRDIYKEMCSRG